MKKWREPFQAQIEQVSKSYEQAEKAILTIENATADWNDKRKIITITIKMLEEWWSKIRTLTKPFDFQQLHKERQRLINSWQNITWRHPLALQVRWGNVILRLQIIMLQLWSYRFEILITIGILATLIVMLTIVILLLPLILTFIASFV